MQRRVEARVDWVSRWIGGLGLVCCMLAGCGSDVVVADQGRHSDAAHASDAGDAPNADAGDTSSIRLCGTARCSDFSVSVAGQTIQLFACCADERRSACGIVEGLQCAELSQGRVNADCTSLPSQVTSSIGEDLPGCCRPDNTCGLYDTKYGFGCVQFQVPSIFFPGGTTPCTY